MYNSKVLSFMISIYYILIKFLEVFFQQSFYILFHYNVRTFYKEKKLKLDSLGFLSIKGLYNSMGFNNRNNLKPQFTDHCFTGDYPTELTDKDEGILSSQLSLLSDS